MWSDFIKSGILHEERFYVTHKNKILLGFESYHEMIVSHVKNTFWYVGIEVSSTPIKNVKALYNKFMV